MKMSDLIERWDLIQESKDIEDRLNSIIDGKDLVMFFIKNGSIFGSNEEGRVIFAKLKNPSEDEPESWGKEAFFNGLNLEKALGGEKEEKIFKLDDLDELKIVDEDTARDFLRDKVVNSPNKDNLFDRIRILKAHVAQKTFK